MVVLDGRRSGTPALSFDGTSTAQNQQALKVKHGQIASQGLRFD